MNVQSLALTSIRGDGTQSRAAINEKVVCDYAERMAAGDTFPPVVVFYDGTFWYLADGFHRVLAAKRAGKELIECDVCKGTKSEALVYSLGANVANGLQRTNADKRRCVEIALAEFPKLSDRAIARMCGVSDPFVGSTRLQVLTVSTQKRTGLDGKEQSATKTKASTKDILPAEPAVNVNGAGTTDEPALIGSAGAHIPLNEKGPSASDGKPAENLHTAIQRSPEGEADGGAVDRLPSAARDYARDYDHLSSALQTSMSAEFKRLQAATRITEKADLIATNVHFLKGYWHRATVAERREFLAWVQTEEAQKEKAQVVAA